MEWAVPFWHPRSDWHEIQFPLSKGKTTVTQWKHRARRQGFCVLVFILLLASCVTFGRSLWVQFYRWLNTAFKQKLSRTSSTHNRKHGGYRTSPLPASQKTEFFEARTPMTCACVCTHTHVCVSAHMHNANKMRPWVQLGPVGTNTKAKARAYFSKVGKAHRSPQMKAAKPYLSSSSQKLKTFQKIWHRIPILIKINITFHPWPLDLHHEAWKASFIFNRA